MSTFYISHNGGASTPLLTPNIIAAVINRYNLDVETLTLTVATPDLYAAPIYAYGDTIRIYRDGTCIFVGTITTLPATGRAGEERRTYVASSAWWKLQRIIYQQPYVKKSEDFTTFLGSYSTKVVLGQDSWGRKITTNYQITDIVSYAAGHGSGLSLGAALATLVTPYLQEARDITCADAIRRMIALSPDCVGWCDYSTGSCLMRLQRRAALSTLTLDLADKNLVEVLSNIGPRNDLLIRGVLFTYITTAEDADGKTWTRETRDTAGAITGEGVVAATIELANQGTAQAETVPAGLAAAFYAARGTLQWQGSIRLKQRDCTGALRPGLVLNLANGATAWATMNATVQAVTEDLLAGTTDAEFGPPEHLGPQDFVAIMTPFRERKPASDFSAKQHNGTEGIDVEDPSDEFPTVPVAPPAEGEVDPPTPTPSDDKALPPQPPGMFSTVDIVGCVDDVPAVFRAVGTRIS